MSTHLTPKELRSMPREDLHREIKGKSLSVAKMRLDVAIGSQKDTAEYRREKREFARLLTIAREQELNSKPKKTTVSALARRSSKSEGGLAPTKS